MFVYQFRIFIISIVFAVPSSYTASFAPVRHKNWAVIAEETQEYTATHYYCSGFFKATKVLESRVTGCR